MDASTISATKGADVFVFDYAHLDVAYSVTLGSGDWGLYQADGTIAVGQTIAPQIGTDGVTSQPGTFQTSISLFQLATYTTARVHYDGQGFTLDYTLDSGGSWTSLAEDGIIALPANADFDLRVTFPGNIAFDSAVLNTLSVYVLNTENIRSEKQVRTLAIINDTVTPSGLVIDATPVTVNAANSTAIVDPNDPTVATGPADYNVGTIEMWTTPQTASVFYNGPAGRVFTNGVEASPVAGVRQHVVLVLDTPANISFELQAYQTVDHLAVYQDQLADNDVLNLYIAQTGGQTVTVNDISAITVTESSPATDVYAYAWQIQSGGNS